MNAVSRRPKSGSLGRNLAVLRQSSLLLILVLAAGIVSKVMLWDSKLQSPSEFRKATTIGRSDLKQPRYIGAVLEAWQNGSLTGRQLHVELGLSNAVVPAIYNCFHEPYKGLERTEGQPCFYLRTPIPVIGTNTVNNPEMLRRLVLSIDVPVQSIIIIVNTIPGDAGKQDELEMLRVIDELQEMIGRSFFTIIQSGCNRGCAGGWNTIIHSSSSAPWWLFVNDDAAFKPGGLRTLYDYVTSKPDVAFFKLTGFQVFIMTQLAVAKVGVFDENIWPAYIEDCDYDLRLKLSGLTVVGRPPEFSNVHGDPESGSSSSLVDSRGGGHAGYGRRNQCSHSNNRIYYQKKWNLSEPGCAKQLAGMFLTPYGNPFRNLASWTFDEALRSQSMSCWEPANSIEKWIKKDALGFYSQIAVPGDQPSSDWKQVLNSLQPNIRIDQPTPHESSASGLNNSPCVSPFAHQRPQI